MLMTVLVAWNGTAASNRAVQVAVDLARRHGTDLFVLRLFEHATGDSPTQARREISGVDAAEQELVRLVEEITSDDLTAAGEVRHGTEGSVAQAVLAAAEELPASMIVIGAEPRSALANVVLGSATTSVVTQARCPVVTVTAT